MRWQGRRESSNVRDQRGGGGFGGGFGGGMGGMGGLGGGGPFRVRRAGGGGIGAIVVILIVAWLFGVNPLDLLSGNVSTTGQSPQSQTIGQGGSDEGKQFVSTVLADTEDVWRAIFADAGKNYPEPTLTLFNASTQSGCGFASAATGPFYCPTDQSVYIDLSFFRELSSRFGAPGDFAQAYVIAHEVGHHVQNVLGILDQVHEEQGRLPESAANALSVRTELQADCLAGVWANHTEQKGWLDPGDIDEGLRAAASVGDDTLQKETQGYVVPDSFTHGTSEQRTKWFRQGYAKGTVDGCDTFAGEI